MNGRNVIGHFSGTTKKGNPSDKVYILSVRELNDGKFAVIAKYGKRGGHLKEEVKSRHATLEQAKLSVASAFHGKEKNSGYVNIESTNYCGPMKRADVAEYLEKEDDPAPLDAPVPIAVVDEVPEPPAPITKPEVDEEFVVECRDNAGMEESFDLGVTYIAWINPNDSEFYMVCDKAGAERECFPNRFVVVEED